MTSFHLDFSLHVKTLKDIDAYNFEKLYQKLAYYRPSISQYFRDKLISVPSELKLVKIGEVPIYVKSSVVQELLDSYNLVSDLVSISAVISIGWIEKNVEFVPAVGDVFEHRGIKYSILKIVDYDHYGNTMIPLHYLVTCERYKELGYVRDIESGIKDIMPAKTANMYDEAMRGAGLVKDPDDPSFMVKN